METFYIHTAFDTQVVFTAGIAEISAVSACTAVTADAVSTVCFGTFAAFRAQPAVGLTAVCTVHTVCFASAVKLKTALAFRAVIVFTAGIALAAVGTDIGTAFAHAAHGAVRTAVTLAVVALRAWRHFVNAFFVTFHTGVAAAVWTELNTVCAEPAQAAVFIIHTIVTFAAAHTAGYAVDMFIAAKAFAAVITGGSAVVTFQTGVVHTFAAFAAAVVTISAFFAADVNLILAPAAFFAMGCAFFALVAYITDLGAQSCAPFALFAMISIIDCTVIAVSAFLTPFRFVTVTAVFTTVQSLTVFTATAGFAHFCICAFIACLAEYILFAYFTASAVAAQFLCGITAFNAVMLLITGVVCRITAVVAVFADPVVMDLSAAEFAGCIFIPCKGRCREHAAADHNTQQ